MTHRDKSLTPWIVNDPTPAELLHQEIERVFFMGDAHVAMIDDTKMLHEQALAYARAGGLDHVILVHGGDYVHHHEPIGHDATVRISDDDQAFVDAHEALHYHLDYKTIEDRMLQYMQGLNINVLDVPIEKYLGAKTQEMVDKPAEPGVRPSRANKKRDWEQRNRKQRR